MKHLKITLILLLAVFVYGCKPNSDKLLKQITQKEKDLFTTGNPIPDKTKVKEMIDLYLKFADNYPKDSLAPNFLYKAANLSTNTKQNENAIALLDRIISVYPNFSKLPETYFLKAFIYENEIKNMPKAKAAYTEFLQKYPKNDLAHDAAISLENLNLGKTPDMIVKEFEAKQKRVSDSINEANNKKK
jgi:outer membrane protein assembly factor BamD (BamD/ComL family)